MAKIAPYVHRCDPQGHESAFARGFGDVGGEKKFWKSSENMTFFLSEQKKDIFFKNSKHSDRKTCQLSLQFEFFKKDVFSRSERPFLKSGPSG